MAVIPFLEHIFYLIYVVVKGGKYLQSHLWNQIVVFNLSADDTEKKASTFSTLNFNYTNNVILIIVSSTTIDPNNAFPIR